MSKSNKSQRIRVNLDGNNDEKHLKVQLEQNIDFLELLSLKISQKDIYQSFNSDYGVLAGRVVANGQVGVANAKISIFIPIDDDDLNNSDIYAVYPYETPRDTNADGKRYNLLPRVSRINPETSTFKPNQPFGSFPTKEEIVSNETLLEVYKKYYKYSTVTNNSGDYMLFGVPVGTQTVHLSVDITDIGQYSMTPTDMIVNLGYSPNLFTSDGTRIKPSEDLTDLPHIETQEISVDVVPFWGDTENFEIGITRQDFRIRAELVSTFTVFGSHFTMHQEAVYGDPGRGDGEDYSFYRLSDGNFDWSDYVDFRTNRIGSLNLNVYSLNPTTSKEQIDSDITGTTSFINSTSDIFLVDENSYFSYNVDGEFLVRVPCNRRKIITGEFGEEIEVDDDNPNGVFTRFFGFLFFEYEDLEITHQSTTNFKGGDSGKNGRLRIKFPQENYNLKPYDEDDIDDSGTTSYNNYIESEKWRKTYFPFESGKLYSVAQFFPSKGANNETIPWDAQQENTLFYTPDRSIGMFKVEGGYLTEVEEVDNTNADVSATANTFTYQMPYTINVNGVSTRADGNYFTGQWLNFSMYFPQIKSAGSFTNDRDQDSADTWFSYFDSDGEFGEWFTDDDTGGVFQELFAGQIGTRYVASRASSVATTFVEVPRQDLVTLRNELLPKGFDQIDLNLQSIPLNGNYKYRVPNVDTSGPITKEKLNEYYLNNASDERYVGSSNPKFFRGMYDSDCIELPFRFAIT